MRHALYTRTKTFTSNALSMYVPALTKHARYVTLSKLETNQSREKRIGELIFSIVFRFVANRLKHLFIGRV